MSGGIKTLKCLGKEHGFSKAFQLYRKKKEVVTLQRLESLEKFTNQKPNQGEKIYFFSFLKFSIRFFFSSFIVNFDLSSYLTLIIIIDILIIIIIIGAFSVIFCLSNPIKRFANLTNFKPLKSSVNN